MRTLIKTFALIISLNIASAIFPKQASGQVNVSFQLFYDQLSPYGQWVDDPDYGYAWIPNVGPDFVPYSTEGHWVFTDYGWTWVSYYDWGWAPFHYGRWDYNDNYGWFWVPDNEWGPSWVVWRRSEGYYGWAPMRPGISINVAYGRDYYVPTDRWIFVRDRDIWQSHIDRYYVGRSYNVTIIKNTTIINRTYEDRNRHVIYVSGPDRDEVQRVTGRSVRPVIVNEYDRPGERLRGSNLRIYRPEVQRNYGQEHKPVPTRVVNSRDYRRPSERNATNERREVSSPNDNNRREHQTRTIDQPTNNNVQQPSQQRNANPSENTRTERQPRTVQPTNNNVEQPSQQRNANPPENTRTERKPRTVNQPENNNVQQPSQQRNTNQSNSNQSERPTRTVNQPANNSNVQQPQKQQPANSSNTDNRRKQRQKPAAKPAEKEKSKEEQTNQDRR